MHRLIEADILRFCALYRGERFHALLSDPPYHLTSIVKRFGKTNSKAAQHGKDGAFARASRGFMGKQWDGGDIAFRAETWEALASIMLPGAFGMVYASARGYHRQAAAIEDAGLILHPSIFGWAYGSGFPKATRIDTQIDRAAGASRTRTEKRLRRGDKQAYSADGIDYAGGKTDGGELDAPATELAQTWAGHRYGMQALKPALEPILVFQKPYERSAVLDITKYGAGALNIDGARIDAQQRDARGDHDGDAGLFKMGSGYARGKTDQGRWAANFVLDAACADKLDAQSGVLKNGGNNTRSPYKSSPVGFMQSAADRGDNGTQFAGDSGGASRFFYRFSDVREQIECADQVYYCAKASTSERERGLQDFEHTTVNDGRETAIDNPYQRGETKRRNTHPTVKPIALSEHLATLLLPPDAYAPRRLLVPFAGSGSEMIGALHAGWDCIVGIEKETEYADIARARLAYWANKLEQERLTMQQLSLLGE